MKKEEEIIILCDRYTGKELTNYKIGKFWAGIVYCTEHENCNKRDCPYKKVVE